MKIITVLLILCFISWAFIFPLSCIKTKDSYLRPDSSGKSTLSKIIWFQKISSVPYVADSFSVVEVTVGIDSNTTKNNNKILLSTDDGVWFDNNQITKEVQAGANGFYTVALTAYRPGKHVISAKIGDFTIDDTLVFETSCPERLILISDKISGSADYEFSIDINLVRSRGIVSDGLPITISAKLDSSSQPLYVVPAIPVSLYGKASIKIKNPYGATGHLKVVASVSCGSTPVPPDTLSITIK